MSEEPGFEGIYRNFKRKADAGEIPPHKLTIEDIHRIQNEAVSLATRAQKLKLFEDSIGKKFCLTTQLPVSEWTKYRLVDEIMGVDRQYNHVIGKSYGNFHIDLVELHEDPAGSHNLQEKLP